jgi:glycerophosphoryl diester phosphodiesterase
LGVALPPVIGHRGAAALAPENTLAGLRAAAAAGARWVEFDVKLTADGTPVLMHDETLERTTDGRGKVAATPAATIAALDAGAWFGAGFAGERVPTLIEAIGELGRLGLGANIEIKPCRGREAATAAAVVEVVARHWPAALPAPLISSFAPKCLAVARDRAPALPRGLLVRRLPRDWRRQVDALGCASINLGQGFASRRAIAAVRAAGLRVVIWTVNEPVAARRLLAAGADAVITDRPEAVLGGPRQAAPAAPYITRRRPRLMPRRLRRRANPDGGDAPSSSR